VHQASALFRGKWQGEDGGKNAPNTVVGAEGRGPLNDGGGGKTPTPPTPPTPTPTPPIKTPLPPDITPPPTPTPLPFFAGLGNPFLYTPLDDDLAARAWPRQTPASTNDRADVYDKFTKEFLQNAKNSIIRGIRFFRAAARVAGGDQLGNSENFWARLFTGIPGLDALTFGIGDALYRRNRDIALYLVSDPDPLIDPLTKKEVKTSIQWDIFMVAYEQQGVQGWLSTHAFTQDQVDTLNFLANPDAALLPNAIAETFKRFSSIPTYIGFALFGAFDSFFDLYTDNQANRWVKEATGDIDFTDGRDRIAIGVATIFDEHGLSQESFNAYINGDTQSDHYPPSNLNLPSFEYLMKESEIDYSVQPHEKKVQ
jgi:hypothetical protein